MAAILDQQQTTVTIASGWGFATDDSTNIAQSFVPSQTAKIIDVIIELKREGTPGSNVSLSIYSNNAGSPGTLLQSADSTISANTLPIAADPAVEHTFHFTNGPQLTLGTTYWMVCSASSYTGDYVNYLYTLRANDLYASGLVKYSDDNGSSWYNGSGDFYFKEYYDDTTIVTTTSTTSSSTSSSSTSTTSTSTSSTSSSTSTTSSSSSTSTTTTVIYSNEETEGFDLLRDSVIINIRKEE